MTDDNADITTILTRVSAAERGAFDRLLPIVYAELHGIAEQIMRKESPGNSLQPTALVNEAYFRLVDLNRVDWQGRSHFFAVGATIMRRILVDHARHRLREKRGGKMQRIPLEAAASPIVKADALVRMHFVIALRSPSLSPK
jgi:RNA polymerase sigma factor (TIGR02999 family)